MKIITLNIFEVNDPVWVLRFVSETWIVASGRIAKALVDATSAGLTMRYAVTHGESTSVFDYAFVFATLEEAKAELAKRPFRTASKTTR